LLTLKKEYKTLTGTEYKPVTVTPTTAQKQDQPLASSSTATAEGDQLLERIAQQGEKVRESKANKASKVSVQFLLDE
jgi:hypothetical protein